MHRIVFVILLFLALPGRAELEAPDINEGELRFLTEPPAQPPHLHSTQVSIGEESLRTGWVGVRQCHYRFGPLGAMEVVFNKERVRKLRIVRADHIGRAWIEGASVQLADVGTEAVLCLQSENRSLQRNETGAYAWHGGPYMRRFLDGYFPMQVQLALDYPPAALRLLAIEPPELKLKAVAHPGLLRLEALFEGRLDITVRFAAGSATPGVGWQ